VAVIAHAGGAPLNAGHLRALVAKLDAAGVPDDTLAAITTPLFPDRRAVAIIVRTIGDDTTEGNTE